MSGNQTVGQDAGLLRLLRRIMEKTVKFKLEKETKNTVRFNEVPEEGQPPIIGTLYVQKWFAGNATELEVTVKKA